MNLIIIRYGELGTKKKNKKIFINRLYNNIKNSLVEINISQFKNDYDRFYIYYDKSSDFEKISKKLDNISGIANYSKGYVFSLDIEEINNNIVNLLPFNKEKTFKVITKRSNKNFPIKSMDVSLLIAAKILKETSLKVDVNNPQIEVNLEIRDKNIFLYFEKIKGIGGLPLGTAGKSLLLLSGGIDSPVAGFEMIKKGVEIAGIHFYSPPYTSVESLGKVKKITSRLLEYQEKIDLFIVNFTNIQTKIFDIVDESYAITIMRRMMIRIASIVKNKYGYLSLVTGESIGQVASQTLESMGVINEVSNDLIIRPLITKDKKEIIEISRMINTYDVSIEPYEDCCTIFTPKRPVIKPTINKAKYYEKKIEIDNLIEEAINQIEIIAIKKEEGFYF